MNKVEECVALHAHDVSNIVNGIKACLRDEAWAELEKVAEKLKSNHGGDFEMTVLHLLAEEAVKNDQDIERVTNHILLNQSAECIFPKT